MPARPIIAIPATVEPLQHGAWKDPCAYQPNSYVEALQQAGATAILIPPDPRLVEDPEPILALVDGLLLAGGADVDPASYGAERDPHTDPPIPERDALEIALVRGALARELPILGICRGLQILNVALGGTLIQHLPDVIDSAQEHRRHLGTFIGNEHDVAIEPDSLVARVAGAESHVTFSHHHQAVDRLGAGLRATAHSADGIIEAAEDPSCSYVLGVQWHPEADPDSPFVGSLVAAARERRSALAR